MDLNMAQCWIMDHEIWERMQEIFDKMFFRWLGFLFPPSSIFALFSFLKKLGMCIWIVFFATFVWKWFILKKVEIPYIENLDMRA